MVINSKTCSYKNSMQAFHSVLCMILRIFRNCALLCGFDRIVRSRTRSPCQKLCTTEGRPQPRSTRIFSEYPRGTIEETISSFHSPGLTSKISLIIIANDLLHFDNLYPGCIFGTFVARILFECPQVTIEKELHLRF